jgi:hypothetical protein
MVDSCDCNDEHLGSMKAETHNQLIIYLLPKDAWTMESVSQLFISLNSVNLSKFVFCVKTVIC